MSYATLAEFRAAGFATPGWPAADYPSSYLQDLLDRAADLIDELTGCRFERHAAELYFDGSNQRLLGPLTAPLIEIAGLSVEISGTTYTGTDVTNSIVLVEKRPGDRRTQFLRTTGATGSKWWKWPIPYQWGDQNIVLISDAFGWVDTSVSPERAPSPIIQLNIDLAARLLIKGYNETTATETSSTGGLKREKQDAHWEREWFEDTTGGGSKAKGWGDSEDIMIVLAPYTFRPSKFSMARVPRG